MKYLFAFVILATAIPGGWMACKTVEELDQCAYEVAFLENRDLKVPTNDGEVVAMCGKAQNSIKCFKEQLDCMKGAAKSMGAKILGDFEKHLKSRCDSPPHRAEFLKHVQCFTDAAKLDAVRICSDKHMVMIEKVSNLPQPLRRGGVCCTAHGVRECVINEIHKQCSGETGEYFNDMINEVTEENLEMVCNEFSTIDQCNAKYDAATWNDLKAVLASTDAASLKKNHHYKTVVPFLVKMVKEAMGGRRRR